MTAEGMTGELNFGAAHWSDAPREPDAPDDLGRGAFTESVVLRIESAHFATPSIVFGLVGPWGSGKSSIIAKVRSGLSDDWLVSDFTPWSTGDSAAMSVEFVSTLADLLGVKAKGELRKTLVGYAGYLAPLLQAIPLVGAGVEGVADGILETLASRPPWHRQFAELSYQIQALGKRVLIVVDDVDRLGGDELLTLLRIIRLLGRFRGVHYLVAYDQDTVEDLLISTGSVGRSASFMEKIVQFPFEVPPISRASSLRLVNSIVNDLLSASAVKLDEIGLQRCAEIVGVLAPQIDTPRTLARFREQLMSFAEHVHAAELDVLDYLAVTWLRLSAHGVWAVLDKWHRELVSGTARSGLLETGKITTTDWEGRVAQSDRGADRDGTVRVLSFLFPGVDVLGLSFHTEHRQAAADETYFGRYLLLALPEDDVSDELIRDVMESLAGGEPAPRSDELARILDGVDAGRANLAYTRAIRLRRESETTEATLLRFLAARFKARQKDNPELGAPRSSLRSLIAAEVALGVLGGVFGAQEVIDWFGEDESFGLLLLASRMPRHRSRRTELAEFFAAYWVEQLKSRLDDLLTLGAEIGMIADLLLFARGTDGARGILDFAISDFEKYLAVAQTFVHFERWVGSEVTYTMNFRVQQFVAVISKDVREKYGADVSAARMTVVYELEDLPEPKAPTEIIRAFTLDSLSSPSVMS